MIIWSDQSTKMSFKICPKMDHWMTPEVNISWSRKAITNVYAIGTTRQVASEPSKCYTTDTKNGNGVNKARVRSLVESKALAES